VHGDFRLDNILTDEHDHPAAVIDWEMATLATRSLTSRSCASTDGSASTSRAAGQTVGDGFAGVGEVVPALLDAGLAALKETY
jgi:aminoglycoside phosphotransferase (APT) family kinase protein